MLLLLSRASLFKLPTMRHFNQRILELLACLSVALLLVPHAHALRQLAVAKEPASESLPAGHHLRGLHVSWADGMSMGTGDIRSSARTTGDQQRGSGNAVSTAIGVGPTHTAARGGWGNFGGDSTSGNRGVTTGFRDGQVGAEYVFQGGENMGPYSVNYSVVGGAGAQLPEGMGAPWRRLQSTNSSSLRGPVRVAAVGVSEEQAVKDAEALMDSANQLLYSVGSYRNRSYTGPYGVDTTPYNQLYGPGPINPNADGAAQHIRPTALPLHPAPPALPVHHPAPAAIPVHHPAASVDGKSHFNSTACEYFMPNTGLYCTRRFAGDNGTCSTVGYPLCLDPSSELSPYYVAVPEGAGTPAYPMPNQAVNNATPVIPSGATTPDAFQALSNAQHLMHQANTLLEQIDTTLSS